MHDPMPPESAQQQPPAPKISIITSSFTEKKLANAWKAKALRLKRLQAEVDRDIAEMIRRGMVRDGSGNVIGRPVEVAPE